MILAVLAVLAALAINWWAIPAMLSAEGGERPSFRPPAGVDKASKAVGDLLAPPAEAASARRAKVQKERGRDDASPKASKEEATVERPAESERAEAAPAPQAKPPREKSGDQTGDETGGRPSVDQSADAKKEPSGPPVFHLDRQEVDRRLETPERISERFVVRPRYDEEGMANGLRVVSLAGPYTRLGLRRGDVVVAINGREVTNQWSAIALLREMHRRKVFNFTVERGGERRTVRYVVE